MNPISSGSGPRIVQAFSQEPASATRTSSQTSVKVDAHAPSCAPIQKMNLGDLSQIAKWLDPKSLTALAQTCKGLNLNVRQRALTIRVVDPSKAVHLFSPLHGPGADNDRNVVRL
ncbi:MAG TPA: hypothetical protein VFS42_01090 [Burkholderiaceae bacterium]|nr:hypothetical protein [Burkholderiaceae bacterium]